MARSSTHYGLDWLISPIDRGVFFQDFWDKEPVVIHRKSPGYHDRLPGLDQVDGLMTTSVYSADRLDGRLIRTNSDGSVSRRSFKISTEGRLDIHDVYRAYDQGHTVILNRIESKSAAVGALCRQVEMDIHHRVGANLYLTPARTQGANPHIDAHDVIIAQVHGSKTWRVSKAPVRRDRAGADSEQCIELDDYHEWVVHSGDALYIPMDSRTPESQGMPRPSTLLLGSMSSLEQIAPWPQTRKVGARLTRVG